MYGTADDDDEKGLKSIWSHNPSRIKFRNTKSCKDLPTHFDNTKSRTSCKAKQSKADVPREQQPVPSAVDHSGQREGEINMKTLTRGT